MNRDRLQVLAETDARSFSAACPNCGEIICQLSLGEPGAISGFEAVCGECDSAVFLADAVAIPDGGGWGLDVPVETLRETALEFYDRHEHGRAISGEDWGWAR